MDFKERGDGLPEKPSTCVVPSYTAEWVGMVVEIEMMVVSFELWKWWVWLEKENLKGRTWTKGER